MRFQAYEMIKDIGSNPKLKYLITIGFVDTFLINLIFFFSQINQILPNQYFLRSKKTAATQTVKII